jgi:glycosyltransferase involved in cell wall biosynthesis
MRIALLSFYRAPNPDYENIASGLRRRGHYVVLGQRNLSDDLAWRDERGELAVQPGPQRLPEVLLKAPLAARVLGRTSHYLFILRVRRFLRQVKPDVVQVDPGSLHGLWMLPLFMPRHMCFILNILQLSLGPSPSPSRLWSQREWWWIRRRRILGRFVYDHACFNHVATARYVMGERWPQWATVVPVGISSRFLTIENKVASRDAGSPVRFVYLGALSRGRELDPLFLAIRQVLSRTRSFHVLFYGPDLAEGFYHAMSNELQLDGVTALKPPIPYEEVPDLLATCDVGLAYVPEHTTWHLQPTIKVLEYRAAGLPILSTDIAGHRDAVEDGVNGLLVRNSVESLAEGMLRFIDDPTFLQDCRRNAANMREALTTDDVARMYEQEVYQKLVD